jgi:hypothetical protein
LIRMLLVPATMELLGARNWWMPRWLDRLLPRLGAEGPGSGTGADGHDEAPRDEAETAEPAPAGEPGAVPSEKLITAVRASVGAELGPQANT